MPVKAAPREVPVTTSWSGFYIGAHVGYGFANTAVEAPDVGLNTRIIGVGSKGWVAGGLAGYNFMISPRWVAGIEVDGSWQNIKTHGQFEPGTIELKLDWSASVRGRLGFLMTPTTMLFGTVGWSWSEFEFSNNLVPESLSRSVNGAQAGFGVETMYAENWIIRTEYLHSFYQRAGVNTDSVGFTASPWVGVIRTGLIYKAGPSNPTPWPDRAPNSVWTGLYAGGLIGALMANGKIDVPSQGGSVDGVGVTAIVPSLLVGYNIQIAPRWLAGIEGEIAPNISTSDVEIEWTGAARLRAGYLVTPAVLAYGSLGWGTASVKNVTRGGTSLSVPIERIHGIGYGTGIEAAVSDRWRLRADYQFYWANKVDIFVLGDPMTVKATAQAARLGAIYAFGGP
jgi:outer membrane immunogenic protein